MVKRIFLVAVLVITAVLAFSVSAAAATGAGTILGTVINGTTDGQNVGSLTVTLNTYNVDTNGNDTAADTATATTDATGVFQFAGLSTASTSAYKVTLQYLGVTYYGDRITFAAGQTSVSTTVKIYESTDKADNIKSHLIQVAAYFVHGQLYMYEDQVFTNSGNYTYVGTADSTGAKTTLNFVLPADADKSTLQFPPDDSSVQTKMWIPSSSIVSTDSGFATTQPIIPGSTTMDVSYNSNYTSPNYTLTKSVVYATDTIQFIVYGTGIKGTSSQLDKGASGSDTYYGPYITFTGQNIQAGTNVSLSLTNLPLVGVDPQSGQSPTATQNYWKWIAIVMAVVVVAFAVAFYPIYRRRRPVSAGPQQSLDDQKEQLLEEIVALDDDFEAGRISEGQYRQNRDAKKAQLAAIVAQLTGKS